VEIEMVLSLPRDAASVPVSRQVLDGCLGILGVTPETRTDITLALSEACANVIQHAGTDDEYEVRACVTDGRCVIEVVNAGNGAKVTAPSGGFPPPGAEHGRGLKIMDAVVENLSLTGTGRQGTTVHFEKHLEWLPGAAGELLFQEASTLAAEPVPDVDGHHRELMPGFPAAAPRPRPAS
jgi:serine/threonine-protein kinase RsbW